MSVLIKGMEMPRSCDVCPMNYDFCWCMLLAGCKRVICKDGFDSETMRLPDCPLIPVPDHGDLIDRDTLDADLEKQDMKTGEWEAIGFSIYEIENAPTIIPAEPPKEEQT